MDAVVPEPEGGAHEDPSAPRANVKTAIVATLRELLGVPTDELLERATTASACSAPRAASPSFRDWRTRMTEPAKRKPANQELIRAVWEEARDLIKRLEGSTVQRFSVEAGGTRIEIERGTPPASSRPRHSAPAPAAARPSDDEGGREADGGHPIMAPLVGTFYRAAQPGADPFVEVGDVVEAGQTVAIVEAMKLMNQVTAEQAGKVAEIVAKDGDWVEFEQVLMYLEPPGEE